MSRTNKLKNKQLRRAIWDKCNGVCVSCNRDMLFESNGSNPPWDCNDTEKYVNGYNSRVFSLDHINPHSLGGSDHQDNLQGMCITCNRKKKNKGDKKNG